MKGINWKPDEKGVPMCMPQCSFWKESPGSKDGDCAWDCTHPDKFQFSAILLGICYPQMVKIVAAAEGMLIPAENAIPYDCDEMELALNALKEALKP